MAELTAFAFHPGNTLLHRLDVRCKLILMVLISLSTVHAAISALSALSLIFVLLTVPLRLSVARIFKDLRYFFFLLALVFLARLFSTPADPLFNQSFFGISKSGLYEAARVCWRLLLIVWMGLLFSASSRISHIQWAVEWFLAPIPFLPGKRIATMMGLIVRFIPEIFKKTQTVAEAQKVRGAASIKNPFIRLQRLAFPMIKSVFVDAENIALAMAARCYSEKSTPPAVSLRRSDWLILGVGLALALAVFLI